MNKWIEKLLGIDKIKANIEESLKQAEKSIQLASEATTAAERAKEAEALAKRSPKEIATEKKEPWVAVLDTHVNKDNIRNGFFELDWNEYFVLQLKEAGYVGDTEESIVDQWFQDLCRNIGEENGVNMERRGSGFINVNNLGDGKTEVS
jgi:hypothetical protein